MNENCSSYGSIIIISRSNRKYREVVLICFTAPPCVQQRGRGLGTLRSAGSSNRVKLTSVVVVSEPDTHWAVVPDR